MLNNSLPLCPCGSGKLYEECCYKKMGADGEPLFFRGAVILRGNKFHPIPNIKIPVIIGTVSTDKYRQRAKEILNKSKLSTKNHEDFINLYGIFYKSYEELLVLLEKPSSGKGAYFQTDDVEKRNCWKEFLFSGRILLDFIGCHSRETLILRQDIGGINKKKYDLLITTLEKLGRTNDHYLKIAGELKRMKSEIMLFIEFRDQEKLPKDTIIHFPAVDENGKVLDGKIGLKDKQLDMISFIKKSFETIDKLTKILLGSVQK